MADLNQFTFLDQAGVRKLAKGILTTVNARINERITLNVDSNSDELHVPSAAAVYRAIRDSKHMVTKVVTGNINTVVPLEERNATTIYWQRDSIEDTKWMIYVWVEDRNGNSDLDGTWICLGDTDINLENYWSKSDQDVASMKYVLGINEINSTISNLATKDEVSELAQIVDGKANASDLEDLDEYVQNLPTYEDLDVKVNVEDLGAIPVTTVQSILDDAEFETEVFYTTHPLIINWLYPDNRTPIAPAYTASTRVGSTYSVTPPVVDDNYYTSSTITGVMPDETHTVNVVFDIVDDPDNPKHLLSVAYTGPEGFVAPETHIELVAEGDTYEVITPTVVGFEPDVASVAGTMANENIIVTVTYTAIPPTEEAGAGEGEAEGGGAELGE